MNGLYIDSVRLNYDKVKQTSLDKYPLNIRCIKNLDKIEFKNRVTFLVGENGIGKSTFIEALALKVGLNPEGGTQNITFSTYDDYSELEKYLWVSKFGIPKTKFFLRAESFYNVASAIDRDYLADLKYQYGGSLHECSHGESFIQLVKNRFTDHGLYILDEPEAALSPTRQMTLLKYIDMLAKESISSPQLMQLICLNICILAESRSLKEINHSLLKDAFRFSTLNLDYDKVVSVIQKGKNGLKEFLAC